MKLALVARSRDKLEGVARSIGSRGATCVAIAGDVTNDDDRRRIIAEAERSIGPIDVLVNNAGIECGGRFVGRAPDEIVALVSTNVTAPMLLARAVLPGMVERGRGHIVNIASIAGKLGYPFAAAYGGTKAALIAWGAALRVELEGTGVSVTTVSPGYVKGAGMFDAHYRKPPRILSETTPEAVASGVLRALRADPVEVVVSGRPFWPVQALYAIAPGPVMAVFKRLGVIDYMRDMLEGP